MRSLVCDDGHTAGRIVASEDRIAEAGAEVIPLDAGRVVRQPAFPHVFDANLVRHPRLSDVGDLDAALRRLAAPLEEVGARHLQISFDAAATGDRLATTLRRRGFVRDRLLAMALVGGPARPPVDGVEVRAVAGDGRAPADAEAPFGWYADTMDRLSREEPWYSPAVSREIVTSLESKASAGVMTLHVAAVDGRPVGAAGLTVTSEGAARQVAAITTVGTLPANRRRGVAQTLVVTLAERAQRLGCDLVYLVARADDTPKEMYRKLGFAVVFGFDVWLRPPGP